MRGRAALVAALVLTGRPASAQGAPLPSSTLALRDAGGAWHEFWSAASAPVMWSSTPLATAAQWKRGAIGMSWAELELRGAGEAWRTRLVIARLDPSLVRFQLDTAFTADREADWTLAHAPSVAVLAINAGQFEATMPWGWVAIAGRRWLPAQKGPLSAALMEDMNGTLHWVRAEDVHRVSTRVVARWAFQSYPAVLAGDSILPPLREGGRGIDVEHRDARAAICLTRTGEVMVAITRFDAAGGALHFIPLGLTVPEMGAVLGALGCRDAMLLDGGISARLRLRDARGKAHDWEGLRPVPLGLLALPR
jgi:hypothetical protein